MDKSVEKLARNYNIHNDNDRSSDDDSTVISINECALAKEIKNDKIDGIVLENPNMNDLVNVFRSKNKQRNMRQIDAWKKQNYEDESNYKRATVKQDMQLRRMVNVTRCKFMACTTNPNDDSDRFIVAKNGNKKIMNNDNKNDDFHDIVPECFQYMQRSSRKDDINKFLNSLRENKNNWNEIEIKALSRNINKYYRNLITTYAKMYKGFSHIQYESHANNFFAYIFLEGITCKWVVKEEVKRSVLISKSFGEHVVCAEKHPYRNIFLHSTKSKDQVGRLGVFNLPNVQGRQNTCMQNGLISAIKHLQEKQKQYKPFSHPTYLCHHLITTLQQRTMKLVGKAMVSDVRRTMNKFGWEVQLLKNIRKKMKQSHKVTEKDKIFNLSSSETFHRIYVASIQDTLGCCDHTIAITDGMIFDSNFDSCLPMNRENLDRCCGSRWEKRKFNQFVNVTIFTGRKKIKRR